MIIPTRWADVVGGMRVILSTGRVVHILARVPGLPSYVMMRNAYGADRPASVDPGALVPVIFDETDVAVATLRAAFPEIEYLREERP